MGQPPPGKRTAVMKRPPKALPRPRLPQWPAAVRGWPGLAMAQSRIARGDPQRVLEKPFRALLRLQNFHRFPEPEGMDDFPLAQKFQAVLEVHVVGHVDQPLIGGPGLLLRRDVFVQIGDRIAYYPLRHNKGRSGASAYGLIGL